MKGRLTNIQPFSIHDGPGIRTTVFLKGCNLHCPWCHNPEAMEYRRQLQWFPQKCIGCGSCVPACPHSKDGILAFRQGNCTACGACAENCYAEALVLTGFDREPEELVKELLADWELYCKSGGGVTFSGGEPYLQPEFLAECLRLLKRERVHTAVETAANVPWQRLEQAVPDLMICDLKSMDGAVLREIAGGDKELILENIRAVSERGLPFWVRVPLIPEFNDSREQMREMAEFICGLKQRPFVELLPFHNMCAGKYASLGIPFPAMDKKPLTWEHRHELAQVWLQSGISVKWNQEGT